MKKTQEIRQVNPKNLAEVPIPKELYSKILQYDSSGIAHVSLTRDGDNLIIKAPSSKGGGHTKEAEADVVALINIEQMYDKSMKYRVFNAVSKEDSIELHFYSEKCVFCGGNADLGKDGIAYYDQCICEKCYGLISKSSPINMSTKRKCVFCGNEVDTCVPFAQEHICEECLDEIKQTPLSED